MSTFQVNDNVGILTLDAPGKNAMSCEEMESLLVILRTQCQDLSGLVITGANNSFCSGLNLKGNEFDRAFPLLDEILVELYKLPYPVVCALSGHAIGAGFLMMCCADVVYSVDSTRAKYGLPEVKIDLGIDALMTETLEMRLSPVQMNELLFTGDYILVDKMKSWGVVDETYEDLEQLMEASRDYIEKARPHLRSYSFTKKLIRAKRLERLTQLLEDKCYKEFTSCGIV